MLHIYSNRFKGDASSEDVCTKAKYAIQLNEDDLDTMTQQ